MTAPVLVVRLPLNNSKRMLGAPLSTLMRWLRHKAIPERTINPWRIRPSKEEKAWLQANGYLRRGQVMKLRGITWGRYTRDNLTGFKLPISYDFWYHRSELGHLPIKAPGERIRYSWRRPPPAVHLYIPITPTYEIDLQHVTKKHPKDELRARCNEWQRKRNAQRKRNRIASVKIEPSAP
jgi:hypothetical protein